MAEVEEVKQNKKRKDLQYAMEVFRLVQQSLYDLDYIFIPNEEDNGEFVKTIRARINFAKEAAGLLPNALNTVEKYLNE